MRESKYRFWEPYTKRMTGPYSLYAIKAAWELPAQCFDHAMQYTGLKDKNGVEVYEGDIISVGGMYKEVFEATPFKSISSGHGDCTFSSGVSYFMGYGQGDDVLVVGNIYEHPELLEAA